MPKNKAIDHKMPPKLSAPSNVAGAVGTVGDKYISGKLFMVSCILPASDELRSCGIGESDLCLEGGSH